MSKKKIAINILGIKLKEGREKAGLSAEEIAIKLADNGVTVRDINDWENGYEIPKEEILYELAKIYKIDVNLLIQIKKDLDFVGIQKNKIHRKKFVGKTFFDIFGDFIVKIIKLIILGLIIYAVIKSRIIVKFMKLWDEEEIQEENYIVEDDYLKMLNSKRGNGKDYLHENN
ncbi:MAG: helix-turn-helix transcriptional regulator [Clostridia bacterium]|nr:helix-turn-helix transcriptional regulator [Clostridia bacterium]